ncbi:MAG: hypothetical protein P9L94_16975 [Candidatus Hinthialibacter antarcticus]|nr:hypothetical protein [Candidatus Hinthialibacter antarcticus]
MKLHKQLLSFILFMACLAAPIIAGEPTLEDVFSIFGFDLTWQDEIRLKGPMQGLFVKTGRQVEILPIAKFGDDDELEKAAIRIGYYSSSKTDELRWLFECDEASNGQAQIYGIASKPGGVYSFQPGAEPFGLYLQCHALNQNFSLDGETVRTQNKPNQLIERFGVDIRKARIFPYRIHGQTKPGWYVVAWEASSNNDYQDLIFVIRGVRLIESEKKETRRRELVEGAQIT